MDEKFRKQMRETFVRGNEFYAGQKPNGTIARILVDHTWSEKYGKVIPRKGRYIVIFQDVGGGGEVISFPPEQLKKALSDLEKQGYEQLVPKPQRPQTVLSVSTKHAAGKSAPQERPKEVKPSQPTKLQPRPAAKNIQMVLFGITPFDCYGKQTRRGFRAYCRRK